MNNIYNDSVAGENTNSTASDEKLLPRSPWDSQLTYMRLIFKAKKALDRIEQEAGLLENKT